MTPDKCTFCKGNLKKSKTDFIVKIKNEVVSIKNVPAYICDQCGEAYFDAESSEKIDKIMKDFHGNKFMAHPIAAVEIDFDSIAA